jgi:hypothetical protein
MACSTSVDATSPFDPQAPASQQAPGSSSGTLVLEGGGGPEAYEEATVELWTLGADAALVEAASVTVLEGSTDEARFGFARSRPAATRCSRGSPASSRTTR